MKMKNIFLKNQDKKEINIICEDENKRRNYENNELKKRNHSVFSKFFFGWVFPVMITANKRSIDENDLVEINVEYDSATLGNRLERYWYEEINNSNIGNRKPSLLRVVWRAFGISFIPSGLLMLTFNLSRAATPLVFTHLIKYWTFGSNMTREVAIYYTIGLLMLVILSSFCLHHSNMMIYNLGTKLRVACSSLLYRKLLRMNQNSLNKVTAGKLVNLMSNDVAKFDRAFLYFHYLWTTPIQSAIMLYLLYDLAGYPPIAGFILMLVFMSPMQVIFCRLTAILRRKVALQSDARIKLMNEIVNGMQVIKMYAWEKPFQEVVNKVRKAEIRCLKKSLYVISSFYGMIQYSDRLSLYVTVIIMYYSGSLASATMIFPMQQYFSVCQVTLTLFVPLGLTNYSEFLVSIQRIQEIMLMAEIKEPVDRTKITTTNEVYRKKYFISAINPDHPKLKDHRKDSNIAVEFKEVCASWDPFNHETVLTNVALSFEIGKLNIIIGPVGSGKTSLFQTLLKELIPIKGNVEVNGNISYASQDPWLFSNTIRENILFGSQFEQKKYYEVCRVCCLNPDFNQFPHGDKTLIGERGINLSGGQRARINLARAIYKEADIYLLDDPLSAVDTHVAKTIFEECINGYLKNKTRILITHQIHFIKVADKIVVMNEGKITNQGCYTSLTSNQSDFKKNILYNEENLESEKNYSLKEICKHEKDNNKLNDKLNQSKVDLNNFDKEFRATGTLSFTVLKKYFSAVNSCLIIFLAFGFFILTQSLGTANDYLFTFWTNEVEEYKKNFGGQDVPLPDEDTKLNIISIKVFFYLIGVLLIGQIALTYIRYVPFISMITKASTNIHNNIFRNLTRAKMSFFDKCPPGRILNRFSKDLGMMDDTMPRSFLIVLHINLQIVSGLILNAFSLLWTILPTAGLILLFIMIMRWNLHVSQSVKRLENTTKSPVLGKINTTFAGITTIRCNKAKNLLIKEFDQTQNIHSNAFYTYSGCTEALALYLDILSTIYLMIIISIFIFSDVGLSLEVGFIGIAISQTMILLQKLQVSATYTTEYLGCMTSVERALEYADIPVEDETDAEHVVPDHWPNKGNLSFKDLSLSYDSVKVLKNINAEIQSGWKIGVVGRTGAGKSSMISALFRLYNTEGSIVIDGIDTSLISKEILRSRISIIPQEPVLFSASLRKNLDPFNVYSDETIWRALEQVELKDVISSLDFNINEGGSNFSVGQRQLICLARAMLRSNKVLVMDEATANVDPQTDALIQQTIRHNFSHCTVITIAHRLNTIMDSDRVLVLEQGQLVEFDHPYILLTNTDSLFYGMVRKTGTKMTQNLLEIASKNYHGL